jgi:hypothetical protein
MCNEQLQKPLVDVLQALFVEAKLQASEELGHYIDELNVSLEEKRVIFHMAQKCTHFLLHAASFITAKISALLRPLTTL